MPMVSCLMMVDVPPFPLHRVKYSPFSARSVTSVTLVRLVYLEQQRLLIVVSQNIVNIEAPYEGRDYFNYKDTALSRTLHRFDGYSAPPFGPCHFGGGRRASVRLGTRFSHRRTRTEL